MKYTYVCRLRPPMPGAIPRDGLISVRIPSDGFDVVSIGGRDYNCWGYVTYDRPLTGRELDDCELVMMKESAA